MASFDYVGDELELFADARNWKAYLATAIGPELRGRVLEVGAGLGSTTQVLCSDRITRWNCLEPDPRMHEKLTETLSRREWPCPVSAQLGTIEDVCATERFDTIIYIDVLEHIADDGLELSRAARYLASGGRMIVLSPAFQFLFSAFDAAIGHHRRYERSALTALSPPGLSLRYCRYLDSVGLMASLVNRVLLRKSLPTRNQIITWDRLMVPLSRSVDPMVGFHFGRSILGVWSKP